MEVYRINTACLDPQSVLLQDPALRARRALTKRQMARLLARRARRTQTRSLAQPRCNPAAAMRDTRQIRQSALINYFVSVDPTAAHALLALLPRERRFFSLQSSESRIVCICSYKTASGTAACTACPANTNSPTASTALTQCTCLAGFNGADGTACTACPANTYKGTTGGQLTSTLLLRLCRVAGAGACTNCPANSQSAAASTAITSCTCSPGFTGPDGSACTACAANTYKVK